tara:strand:- start:3798 stop:4415 length:618 start_codon:yes stop_codon:yes gene_type:complete
MIFYYNGKKAPSKSYDVANGCLLIIALVAIIFMFTLMEDIEDLKEYWLHILIVLGVGSSLLYGVFRKKGELHTYRIAFKNDYLIINKAHVSIEKIHLDIYNSAADDFHRYHFWDTKGVLSIYSTIEDDLLNYFSSNYQPQTTKYIETSASGNGSKYRVITEDGSLCYDLESGEYTLERNNETIVSRVPEFYIYDPKYKKGITKTT